MMIHKINPYFIESANRNLLQFPKLLRKRIRKHFCKTLWTSVINSPLSLPSLYNIRLCPHVYSSSYWWTFFFGAVIEKDHWKMTLVVGIVIYLAAFRNIRLKLQIYNGDLILCLFFVQLSIVLLEKWEKIWFT